MLGSAIDTKSSKPGQLLKAEIMQDVSLEGRAKLKSGTRVLGEIVAVTAASSAGPAVVALRFNQIQANGRTTPIRTSLRALASPLDVIEAQTQTSGFDRHGNPPWDQTLVLIGNDVVYREAEKVYSGLTVVGTSVYAGGWGVLIRPSSNPEGGCRGPMEGNDKPQPLWVFSHDACGIYGYEAAITDAGRTNVEGVIVLASVAGNLKIRKGSGMLLRINSPVTQP
jgi:hypothetical protein